MRKQGLLLCAVAVLFLPGLGLSDGWGRCEAAEGPELDKVQAKIAKLEQKCADKIAKLEQKITKLQEKCDERLAKLQDLLAEAQFFAEFFGDPDGVAKLEAEIQKLLDRYDLQEAKLYDKIVETQEKYDCKVLKYMLKAGIIPPPQ